MSIFQLQMRISLTKKKNLAPKHLYDANAFSKGISALNLLWETRCWSKKKTPSIMQMSKLLFYELAIVWEMEMEGGKLLESRYRLRFN